MKVILHADDFGFDHDTTQATIELLESGTLTSATIMPTMPAAKEAITFAAKHPELSFGVHLTYVDGLTPASDAKVISSLVDAEGLFLPSDDTRKKALRFAANKHEIVKESLAQIRILQEGGVKVSHLDSHGHLHKFPSFLLALGEVRKQSGIERVRRVQNVFVNKPKFGPVMVLNKMFAAYISAKFKSTDYFYMSANNFDTNWSDAILAEMDKLPQNAVIEVGVHPARSGYSEEWRVAEYNDIMEFASKLRAGGKHQIITWNEV